MTEIFNFIGKAFTKFFTIMPVIGNFMNYFIIFAITVGVFYWIWYMMKDPGNDTNYLSK